MFNTLKKHAEANNIQQFEQIILATPEKLFDTPIIKDVYSVLKEAKRDGGICAFSFT